MTMLLRPKIWRYYSGVYNSNGTRPLRCSRFFQTYRATFRGLWNLEKFQAKVINPFLSVKTRAVFAKLFSDVTGNYQSMKTAILRELQLSSNVYLERSIRGLRPKLWNIAFASKLCALLEYYLKSRDVT